MRVFIMNTVHMQAAAKPFGTEGNVLPKFKSYDLSETKFSTFSTEILHS